MRSSNLNKYIPAEILDAPEFSGNINGEEIRLLTADELLLICRAVVTAGFKGRLSQTWQKALPKVQLLLVEFATDGMNKVIDQAIKNNPVLTAKEFARHMEMLLSFNFTSDK